MSMVWSLIYSNGGLFVTQAQTIAAQFPSTTFEAHKVDFFSDVNGHFLGSNCHLARNDISN